VLERSYQAYLFPSIIFLIKDAMLQKHFARDSFEVMQNLVTHLLVGWKSMLLVQLGVEVAPFTNYLQTSELALLFFESFGDLRDVQGL